PQLHLHFFPTTTLFRSFHPSSFPLHPYFIMPVEIRMPQQSDTMTEGTVLKWLKKEADKVKANEPIAEIETDKTTMEMESFESGTDRKSTRLNSSHLGTS